MSVKKGILFLVVLSILLILVRFSTLHEIDDVTPGIPCEESLLQEADILWVIPLFNNESIATNQTWCTEIKALNKTLGLHGVYHRFEEFKTLRNETYLQPGIEAFQECFNQTPVIFKAPQLALSSENKEWLQKTYAVKEKVNQLMHKVYHCNDTGKFSNTFIRWI